MSLVQTKLFCLAIIFCVSLSAAYLPFKRRIHNTTFSLPYAEALAYGIFFGAGLIHMLGDSAVQFNILGYQYPWASLLTGFAFLTLFALDHSGMHFDDHSAELSNRKITSYLAVIMLSIHSFLEGTALGITGSHTVFIVILIAILSHKWAASFALAVTLSKSALSFRAALLGFLIFALMTPIGVLCGTAAAIRLHSGNSVIEPILVALAAGTFLYLGTLHGMCRSLIQRKGAWSTKEFFCTVTGFVIMALVAIYT